jgi:hypothetical protein
MATTWKDRMWHLFLVCVLGVVISVCTSSTSSKKGKAYADFKPSDVTAVMFCTERVVPSSGEGGFWSCDSSDSTSIGTVTINGNSYSYGITLGDLVSAGFRPCAGGAIAGAGAGSTYFRSIYFFCK